MRSDLNHIKKILKGKRIALVGNAKSLLSYSSNEIDDFDVVVRINKGPIVAEENSNIGKRTDILLISAFHSSMNKLLPTAAYTVYMSPSKRDLLSDEQQDMLSFYPTEWWDQLYQKIGDRPSTGCMGIDFIRRMVENGELHLYGFDFWRSPTSYNGINRPGPHNPSAEEAFALAHIPKDRIYSPCCNTIETTSKSDKSKQHNPDLNESIVKNENKIKALFTNLFRKSIQVPERDRIKLTGDHSNYHGGSAAAFSAIRAEVERYGHLVGEEENYNLLIINGEGSMHHSSANFRKKMNQIEKALEANKRVMLINTVWQDNPQASADILSRCDKVVVREVLSQKELAKQGVNAQVCIDQSYHETIDESAPFIDYEGGIVFTDFWSSEFECFVKLTSNWAQKFAYMDMREMSWSSTVKSLRTASLLVTGRHHAVYAACKAETPFISMRGNTHKIEGLFETAGSNIRVYSKFSDIKKIVSDGLIPHKECAFLFDWMKKQPPWKP